MKFKVGDMVFVSGRPGEFMVIELLHNAEARVRQWPFTSAPDAITVGLAKLTPAKTGDTNG